MDGNASGTFFVLIGMLNKKSHPINNVSSIFYIYNNVDDSVISKTMHGYSLCNQPFLAQVASHCKHM